MIVQAMVSAQRPLRNKSPATKMPTDHLVKIRLAKNAARARPSDHKLNPKKAIASKETGIIPIAKRTMLMTMSESRNSVGRNGDIMRLPRLRAYISSRKEMEKPSCPRKRMSHNSTEPMKTPPAWTKKLEFCEI